MPRRTSAVLHAAAVAADVTDADLLARFAGGDDAAFAEVVRRYAGLVQGVCRRVLANAHDAEDATQAVFVVLAKKAGSTRWKASAANWLYTTARKVALKSRRAIGRRTKREARSRPPAAPTSALDHMTGREAFAALDEELDRLPPLYREPLVLCCLQGLSREEAAQRLGVPPLTLKSQLDRGRKRLAAALEQRGVVAGAAVLAGFAVGPALACPPALLESVLAAAGGSPSPAVAALAQGVTVNTWIKPTLLGMAAVAAVSFGFAGFAPPQAATADEKPAMKAEKPAAKKDAQPEKPPSVGGTVVGPDGKPVADATVSIVHGWHDERATVVKVGSTDRDGRFRGDVPKEVPASFLVVATKPGFGIGWEEPKYPSRVLADADKLALKLTKDVPVRGRVLDTEGKPVAGVEVGVYVVIEPTNGDLDQLLKGAANGGFGQVGQWEKVLSTPRSVAGATTDADGKFGLPGLGADRVIGLTLSGKGLARMSPFVVTRAGVDVDPLNKQPSGSGRKGKGRHPVFYGPTPTLVVEPGYAVEGTVTDKATGRPQAGCSLEVNTGYWDRVRTTSDANGRYRFDGLTKGMGHYIHASPPADAALFPTWEDVTEGTGYQTVRKDFALVRGAVFAGKAIDKTTKQPVPAAFQIIPAADNPFAKKPEYETASRDMTWKGGNADGTFRIVTLPGKSEVNINVEPTETLNGRPLRVHTAGQKLTIELKEDGNAELTVEVDRGSAVTLTAADTDGQPLKGVVTCGQTMHDHGFLTEHEVHTLPKDVAEFTVYGLGVKEVRRVVLIHPEKKLAGSRLVTATSEGQIVLRPLQPIRGTFTDESGTPLAGLTVSIDYTVYGLDELFRDHAPKWTMTATTDKNGRFEIPDAIPGLPFGFGIRKGNTNYRGTPLLGTQTVPAGKPLDLGVRKVEEVP